MNDMLAKAVSSVKGLLGRACIRLAAMGYEAFEAESGDLAPLQGSGEGLRLSGIIRQSAQVLGNRAGKPHFEVYHLAVFERMLESVESGTLDLGRFGRFEITGSCLVAEDAAEVPPVILYELRGTSGNAFIFWGGLYALPLMLIQETQKRIYLFHDSYRVQPKVRMLHPSVLMLSFRFRKLSRRLPLTAGPQPNRSWFPACIPQSGSVLMFGFSNNFGHYIWNELSGIHDLIASGLMGRIGCVVVGQYDYCDFASLLDSMYGIKAHQLPLRCERRPVAVAGFMAESERLLFRFNNVVLTDAFCRFLRDRLFCVDGADSPDEASAGHELFSVCFKVRLHNRVCRNQTELVLALARYFRQSLEGVAGVRICKVRLFIDGFSSYATMSQHDRDVVSREKELFAGIVRSVSAELGESVELVDMIGLTVLQKARIARNLHLYISPVGSGGELYTWIYKVPSIYYGLPVMMELAQNHAEGVVESLPRISLVQAQPFTGRSGNADDYLLPSETLLREVAAFFPPAQ